MTTRVLPPEEWPKLAELEADLGSVAPALDANAHIVVVERDGEIIGCFAVVPYVHLEGLWIAPAHRTRAAVGRRLLRAAWAQARDLGARFVLSMCSTPEMASIFKRLGGREVPCPFYEVPVGR